jgi:ATP-dependent Lon protease
MNEPQEKTVFFETLVQSIGTFLKISLSMGSPLPEEVLKSLDKVDHPGRLADLIAIFTPLRMDLLQESLLPPLFSPY